MKTLTLLGFLCASVSTMAEASFSNCPKVSLIVAGHDIFSRPRTCKGSLLRASTRINNIPGTPDTSGRKYYSTKTGFHLYVHIMSNGTERFVSIRWAHNPQYALAEENGQLRFSIVNNTQSTTAPDKFLFTRQFYSSYYQTFQTKSSKRYIIHNEEGCSVGLKAANPRETENCLFSVKCKPHKHRCFCF